MGDKAITVEEQIITLKTRGLVIENEDKAKEILKDIGYYRLRFYWYYFQAIVDIRNACSHTRVIFDFKSEESIKNTKICKILPVERNHLNAIIKVIHYFLTKISNNRASDMQKEIDDLILKHANNKDLIEIIKEKMKYSL